MPEETDCQQLGTATIGLNLDAPVFLSRSDLRRHLYVIGKTGTGKSTLLFNLMRADLEAGRGFALLDPHGDLAVAVPVTTIAVNVSAREFGDDHFLANVFAVLDATGLDPNCLELELTESVLMKRAASAESVLKSLKKRGVNVALDDFGTGYSSLSYLRKFPVDALKIDRAFVRQICTAGDDTILVGAMIAMAKSLKLRVVAEGVETLEEVMFLRAHNCNDAQGYYFGRPMAADQFAELLGRGIRAPFLRLRSRSM